MLPRFFTVFILLSVFIAVQMLVQVYDTLSRLKSLNQAFFIIKFKWQKYFSGNFEKIKKLLIFFYLGFGSRHETLVFQIVQKVTCDCCIKNAPEQIRILHHSYARTNESAPPRVFRNTNDCSTFFKGNKCNCSGHLIDIIYYIIGKSRV